MCSKKDYVAIAKIIANHRWVNPHGFDEMSKDLCEYFERDNPRFDIIRFMKATRGTPYPAGN
jgi:hypothetical protein